MSTKFGIHRRNASIELVDGILPIWVDPDDFIEIGYRTNKGNFIFTSEIAESLPNMMRVYPLDNTAQGIYTIRDLKILNL